MLATIGMVLVTLLALSIMTRLIQFADFLVDSAEEQAKKTIQEARRNANT